MKAYARKTVASLLSAALVAGAFPSGALAFVPAAAAPAAGARVNAGAAMKLMRRYGVTKGAGDVLETYMVTGARLTPLGQAVYLSLIRTHDPKVEPRALAEEAQAMRQALDRLRQNGPYNHYRAQKVDETLKLFEKNFGKAGAAVDGSVEAEFWRGALREALMTGAAVADPPDLKDRVQVAVKDGYEFWDKKGLAYRINKKNATTYNRELQKMQRLMNQSLPPQVKFVPETGRYNAEMFDYSYHMLRNQYDALVEAMRRDRMMFLADLVGEANQYRDDMWFNSPDLEKNLEEKARKKSYVYNNADYNVLALVDAKFKQRRAYLDASLKGVERFLSDSDTLKAELKKDPIATDAQVQSLMLDEQSARRVLTLSALETQLFSVKNLMERVDPASPDSEQVMKAIDNSGMSVDQKTAYKLRAREMLDRLKALRNVLEKTRLMLSAADYAGSLEMANAALNSCQRALGLVSSDYTMYLEIPTLMFLGHLQHDPSWKSWLDPGSKAARGAWGWFKPGYKRDMEAIIADQPKYEAIARLIAAGKIPQARQAVIALHPDAIKNGFASSLSGGERLNDAARMAASLKSGHDRIAAVFETNQWTDTVGRFVSFSLYVALAAPAARIGANWTAEFLTPLTELKYLDAARHAFVYRWPANAAIWTAQRSGIAIVETLKHVEARLGSLEPDPIKIKAMTNAKLLRYMLPSGTRFVSVMGRQAAFTGTAAPIQGAFSVGTHYYKGEDSPFDSGWEAAWEGAKGGVIWANKNLEWSQNEPIELFGVPVLHPGLLSYVGLPASVFKNTRLVDYAEMVGSRGAIDAGIGSGRLFFGGRAARAALEKEAGHGFLEQMGEAGKLGKVGAFGLSMVDNVAKYWLFSEAMSRFANSNFYPVARASWSSVLPSVFPATKDDQGVERYIKRANTRSERWMEAPAWMLIPQYAAHTIRDAQAAQLSREGLRQAKQLAVDRGDFTHLMRIANALDPEALIAMPKAAETPMSQKIYEPTWMGAQKDQVFSVDTPVRREAIELALPKALGVERLSQIEPEMLSRLMTMEPKTAGEPIVIGGLKVDKVVQEVAESLYDRALRRDPDRTAGALDARNGTYVEGYGDMDPALRREIAATLFASDTPEAPLPSELAGRVNKIMESTGSSEPTAADKELVDALAAASAKSKALAHWAQKRLIKYADDWIKDPNQDAVPYAKIIERLREETDADQTLKGPERRVLNAIYKYYDSLEATIRAGDKVGKVHSVMLEWMETLRTRFRGDKTANDLADVMDGEIGDWRRGKNADDAAAGKDFNARMRNIEAAIESAHLTGEMKDAFQKAHRGIKASPWIYRDTKGAPMSGWRPVQFQALMHFLGTLAETACAGEPPQIFLRLKTGGGKTWLSALGLVPFLRADSAALGNKPKLVYLVPQANLKAQVRLQFANVGLKIEVLTYEEFKSKVAQGKMRGHDVAQDYIVLGDEGDAATQQPILTIGRVSGTVPRYSAVFNRIDGISAGLAQQLNARAAARAGQVQTEADRVRLELDSALGGAKDALAAKADALKAKAHDLTKARTAEQKAVAEREIRTAAADLSGQLAALGAEKPALAARRALSSLTGALDARENPAAEEGYRRKLASDVKTETARQDRLLDLVGSEEGLRRLETHVAARSSQLEKKEQSLSGRLADAKSSGQSWRASALEQELAGVRLQRDFLARFENVRPPQRVASLQRSLAAAQAGGDAAPERVAQLKTRLAQAARELPAEARQVAQEHAQALKRLHGLQKDCADILKKIEAEPSGPKQEKLKDRRDALSRDHDVTRGEVERLKQRLIAEDASARRSTVKATRELLRESSGDLLEAVEQGGPGFEETARGLTEERRQLWREFGAEENALYKVFRDIKERMKGYAMRMLTATGGGLEKLDERTKLLVKSAALRGVTANEALNAQRERDIQGKSLLSLAPKMLWNWMNGREVVAPTELGLARWYAWKMLEALDAETMPVEVKDTLRWKFYRSFLSPGSEKNWVGLEVRRMYDGHFDDPSKVRADSIKRKFEAVHGGEWYATMDVPTRRFWEIEFGYDLTLPYTNETLSTIKDLTTNKKARFVMYSGTADSGLQEHLGKNKIALTGKGSDMPLELDLKTALTKDGGSIADGFKTILSKAEGWDLVHQALAEQISSRGEVNVEAAKVPEELRAQFQAQLGARPLRGTLTVDVNKFKGDVPQFTGDVLRYLKDVQRASHEKFGDAQRVILRPEIDLPGAPAEVRAVVETFLENKKWSQKEEVSVSYSDFPLDNAPVQAWLRELRAGQGDTGGVIVVVPDTADVKGGRQYLKRVLGLSDEQITTFFSDVTTLGERRPEARVVRQMNLQGLGDPATPKVKQTTQVIIGDKRVFAIGLDLYLKKYTSWRIVFLDPQLYTESDVIQGAGRSDPDRMLAGAKRHLTMALNVQAVKDLESFWAPVRTDPFFAEVRGSPQFQDFLKAGGVRRSSDIDLSIFQKYIAHRAADGTVEGRELAKEYNGKMLLYLQKALVQQQLKMGVQKLESSGVGTGSGGGRPDSRFPGVGEAR